MQAPTFLSVQFSDVILRSTKRDEGSMHLPLWHSERSEEILARTMWARTFLSVCSRPGRDLACLGRAILLAIVIPRLSRAEAEDPYFASTLAKSANYSTLSKRRKGWAPGTADALRIQ